MILHDVEKVGGRHRNQVLMQELATKSGLRLRDRRLQQSQVADAGRAAVTGKLVQVNRQNFVQRQKRGVHSASFFNTRPYLRFAFSSAASKRATRLGSR